MEIVTAEFQKISLPPHSINPDKHLPQYESLTSKLTRSTLFTFVSSSCALRIFCWSCDCRFSSALCSRRSMVNRLWVRSSSFQERTSSTCQVTESIVEQSNGGPGTMDYRPNWHDMQVRYVIWSDVFYVKDGFPDKQRPKSPQILFYTPDMFK